MRYTQQGYTFETEVAEGLALIDGWYCKVPDTRSGRMRCPRCKLMVKTLIMTRAPCDFIHITPTAKCIFLEAKSTIQRSFPEINIKAHQLETGCNIEALGTSYYFIIYMKSFKRVFSIHAKAAYKHFLHKGCLSIKDLEDTGVELERKTARYHPDKKSAFITFNSILT